MPTALGLLIFTQSAPRFTCLDECVSNRVSSIEIYSSGSPTGTRKVILARAGFDATLVVAWSAYGCVIRRWVGDGNAEGD
jgi:Tfp pilus tip-associated adhesin PilY1